MASLVCILVKCIQFLTMTEPRLALISNNNSKRDHTRATYLSLLKDTASSETEGEPPSPLRRAARHVPNFGFNHLQRIHKMLLDLIRKRERFWNVKTEYHSWEPNLLRIRGIF